MSEVDMRERKWTVLLAMIAVLLFGGCSRDAGTPRNTLATAEETVQAYCDLDSRGMRLTSTNWNKVLTYISWAEEAGFDRAIVISGFTLGKARMKDEKESIVPVAYQVLGEMSGTYSAGRRTETVEFKVVRTGRGWKIVEPDFLPPHVLAANMEKHLEGTKQSEMAEKVRNETK
jgi:hypothetical protein